MSWKQHLFKPKWQNKDAEIRLTAVSTEQDPQLLSALVEIAAADEDSKVRCAAIKRLHKLDSILELYAAETSEDAKSLLQERIRQLAASTGDKRPRLELRLQVVGTTTDRALIEQIASHAPEAELRRAALEKVTRQGFLGDCCIEDEDAENRRFAASQVSQHTTLKRVIAALRTRDKTLHAQLQQRLHEELLEQANPDAIHAESLRICTALEKLAVKPDDQDAAAEKDLHKAWKRIEKLVIQTGAERYQRISERLAAPPVVAAEQVDEPIAKVEEAKTKTTEPESIKPDPTIDETESTPAVAESANEALAQAGNALQVYQAENTGQIQVASVKKLRQHLEKAWRQCSPPHPDDQQQWDTAGKILQQLEDKLEQQQQKQQKKLLVADKLLTQFQQELDDGALHYALITRSKIHKLGRDHGANKTWQGIYRTMNSMQGRVKELREWQHWSNDKVRKRLIAEMEVLPAADLHPDALLDRIKSLQVEWKSLGESEQIPGEKHFAAAPWMWRKFSAAGHTAFDSAREFLDKRSEIQSRQAQLLETFCAELEQLATTEPTDMAALSKAMTRGRKKLHDLNNIPAKNRQKIAKQLKSALDKANTLIQANYELVEKAKMKLIRSASQLSHMPERSEAITSAKALQAQWKSAGSLWRSKEQELWTQFREHLDPLFEELKEQQDSIRAADKEKRAAQTSLYDELKAILSSDDELASLHGKVQGLQDQWRDIQQPDRKLLQAFQEMVKDYEQRVERVKQQQRHSARERWWLKSELLHKLSATASGGSITKSVAAKAEKSWPGDSSDDALEQLMDQHMRDMLDGNGAPAPENDPGGLVMKAQALCIRMEFVAGLPSPEDEREQRMQYQVDRLAESMSGEFTRRPAVDEAREAEKSWLAMYALPEADYSNYGERIKRAITTIIEN